MHIAVSEESRLERQPGDVDARLRRIEDVLGTQATRQRVRGLQPSVLTTISRESVASLLPPSAGSWPDRRISVRF